MPKRDSQKRAVKQLAKPRRLPRLIVYWFTIRSMQNADLRSIQAQMAQIATEGGMELIDWVFDTGPPKKHRDDYPILDRFERGEADVLVVGRSDLLRRSPEKDWLESRTQPQSIVLLSKEDLRRLGVIGKAPATTSKSTRLLPVSSAADQELG